MYHVVMDLEMNPISREYREVRRSLTDEVIEIGAVRLDDSFQQVSEFQCYVRPEYGEIKKHITKLTSITNEMVEGHPHFAEAFRRFMEWIGEEEVTIYSWSMSDLKQFRNECRYKLKEFDTRWLTAHWVDLQKQFDDRLGLHNHLALKHALGAMDRNFEGTQHTALADAANTAAILALMQDDEKFRRMMQPVLDLLKPKEDLAESIGDLCPELMKLKGEL
ncbi:MAG: exonuclease domain-containing protein [Selenomonadaceae bacterium]|nr:exonuclease domain-containing protein [Selenomonadaceae bacterium]